jgi:hypothetical protein
MVKTSIPGMERKTMLKIMYGLDIHLFKMNRIEYGLRIYYVMLSSELVKLTKICMTYLK